MQNKMITILLVTLFLFLLSSCYIAEEERPNTPPRTGTLSTSDVASTSFMLHWTKAWDENEAQSQLQYQAYYSSSPWMHTVSDIETYGIPVSASYRTNITSVSITGLNNATLYYLNVIVKDSEGEKVAYTPISQSTYSISFEDGLVPSSFIMSKDADWFVTNKASYAGSYSLRAGVIGDNQSSCTSLVIKTLNGKLHFYYRVSTELRHDFFRFYIDGIQNRSSDGLRTYWMHHSTSITAGTRTLMWCYTKDSSMSRGSDTVWIDSISWPITQ